MVPSNYASYGASGVGVHVNVGETFDNQVCSPPQWVPQQYCLSQFFAICATGMRDGTGHAAFGAGSRKCQGWNIALLD